MADDLEPRPTTWLRRNLNLTAGGLAASLLAFRGLVEILGVVGPEPIFAALGPWGSMVLLGTLYLSWVALWLAATAFIFVALARAALVAARAAWGW